MPGRWSFLLRNVIIMQPFVRRYPRSLMSILIVRPSWLTWLMQAAALLGSYGSSDKAFLDIVFGAAAAGGLAAFRPTPIHGRRGGQPVRRTF